MKAILLDRDDTLNADPGYLRDPEQVRLLPMAAEGLLRLREAGFRFFVMTNQSGVGRGLISREELLAVNSRVAELLAASGVHIEKFYVCPHVDEDNCDCRKPRPGLFRAFFEEWKADARACFALGDKPRDLEAAAGFGVPGILVRSKNTVHLSADPKNLVYRARDLMDAAQFIVKKQKGE